MIIDVGLDFLIHAAQFFDSELAQIEKSAEASEAPAWAWDALYADTYGDIVGLGFVACQ